MFISIDTMLTTPLLMPPEHEDVCSRMHCCLQPDVARAKLPPVPPPSDEPVPEPAGYEAKFPNDYENYDPAVSVRLLRLPAHACMLARLLYIWTAGHACFWFNLQTSLILCQTRSAGKLYAAGY